MGKAQFPSVFGWSSTNPETNFLPSPGPNCSTAGNSPSSGVIAGTMTGTNVIYTNILGLRQTDNQGIELVWTGTPTGTYGIWVSNSGRVGHFIELTGFNPALVQPSGSAGSNFVQLSPISAQYMYLKYTNASGSGTITAYSQCKANNT